MIVLLLFIGHLGQSQSRKDLEKQRLKIIKDIEKTSKELEKTKQTKEKNLTQLKALEQQMAAILTEGDRAQWMHIYSLGHLPLCTD